MDRPLVELVHPADVVAVDVGGDRQQVVVEVVLDEVAQRPQPERRVDDEVDVAPAHVPHVAAQQRVDVGLGDERDPVAGGLAGRTTDRRRAGRRGRPRRERRAVRRRRVRSQRRQRGRRAADVAAGGEQRRQEAAGRRRAHGVSAGDRERGGVGDPPGEIELARRRHDAVVVVDDHRGRDVDAARPTGASRTATSPVRPPGSGSSRGGRPPRTPTTPASRRPRQPVQRPRAALVRRPSGTVPATALVPVATEVRTRSRVVPRNVALVAHSTNPPTSSGWRRQRSWAIGPPIE